MTVPILDASGNAITKEKEEEEKEEGDEFVAAIRSNPTPPSLTYLPPAVGSLPIIPNGPVSNGWDDFE